MVDVAKLVIALDSKQRTWVRFLAITKLLTSLLIDMKIEN